MADARIVEFLLAGVFDLNGNPVNAGKIYSYAAGTDTPKTLYTDAAKISPATNPVILDASGRAIVYADGNYKFIVKKADDTTLFTADNCQFQLDLIAHDTYHEDGGSDEVTPMVHHTRHEPGGADAINFPLASHATNHQNGGADEVLVTGLSGLLADDQHVLDAEVLEVAAPKYPRVTSIESSAAPTPNCDTQDMFVITALATDAYFVTPTGTPQNGQKLIIRIMDNATPRFLFWDAGYKDVIALPDTTVTSSYTYIGLIYCSVDSKWHCVACATE